MEEQPFGIHNTEGLQDWQQANTAGVALAYIRGRLEAKDLGREFENLFSHVAQHAPELEVLHIWELSKWPDVRKHKLDGRDIGVDRVAVLKGGEVVAIQCKCYSDSYKVGKDDVTKFLSGSQNEAFQLRWLVTTSGLTRSVVQMLQNTNVRHINFHEFADHPVKWKKRHRTRTPFPLQKEAIEAVEEGLGNPDNDRGQLVMACGTGKTFVALEIAARLVPDGGRILFLAPSIALVAQARKEWLTYTKRPLHGIAVCSDRTVGSSESVSEYELPFPVTTDPGKISQSLSRKHNEGVSVVFCTYQSLDKVVKAQKEHGAPAFDLAIADEAHRTAGIQVNGEERRAFQIIHHQDQIQCGKRLYMTATPRIYGAQAMNNRLERYPDITITDMNDYAVYGRPFYRLTFRKAVNADMLCDVRVICLGLQEEILDDNIRRTLESISNAIRGHGKPPETQEYMSALVIGLALNGWIKGKERLEIPSKLPRTLAYANTKRRSKWLEDVLNSEKVREFLTKQQSAEQEPSKIIAKHLDAGSSAAERRQELQKLNVAEDEDVLRVITNCRLFSEGVDVPDLNSVAFLDSRDSTTDIIQSIGRVMRKGGENKKLGYIIAPVSLRPGESVTQALEERSPRFEVLGKVLCALQSHDEELYSKLGEVLEFDIPQREKGDPELERDKEAIQQPLPLPLDAVYALLANYSGLGNRGKIIAKVIISAVKRAARIFNEERVAKSLANVLGSPQELLDSLSEEELESKLKEATHTSALVICNACLMHKRLGASGHLGDINPLERMSSKAEVMRPLLNDWKAILQKDYKPIFKQASVLIEHLHHEHGDKAQLQSAVQILVNCAVEASESLNELGYDHAGPLYHQILDKAPSQGAFYTKNLSALLMAQLVFSEDAFDWKDEKRVKNLRVIDPCCGTGTLLMAALKTIKERVSSAKMGGGAGSSLHKSLIENSIYGFDITSQAVQLAACNLTLGAPDVSYDRMNLHTLEYGMAHGESEPLPGNVRQGSLELFDQLDLEGVGEKTQPLLSNVIAPTTATGVVDDGEHELSLPANFDAVIMNPPFTDTSKQKAQFPSAVGNAMSRRLQNIADLLQKRSPDAHRALAKMSLRPFFTPLSEQLVAKDKGALAKIIPTTAVTANNGVEERRYLANRFHIEMVITSHDPKNIAFSASTSIHESMIIARRRADKSAPTRLIQLARMPVTISEVEELSRAIHADNLGDWGNCTLWPAEKIQGGDWSPVQWYSTELVEAVEHINTLDGLEISGANYQWSPGGQEFRGAFTYETGTANKSRANAYCSIDESKHRCIASPPDTWAVAKPGKEEKAAELSVRGGHVLVPCRVSTTSSRVLAVFSNNPAVGSAFRPIDSAEALPQETAKAYAVFLNSSFGILQFFNRRTRKLTYPAYETGHMETLLLPSKTKLDLQPLTALFDETRTTELSRFAEAHKDPTRKRLDHAVAKLLDVAPALTDKWRELLAQEPTISNQRRAD